MIKKNISKYHCPRCYSINTNGNGMTERSMIWEWACLDCGMVWKQMEDEK